MPKSRKPSHSITVDIDLLGRVAYDTEALHGFVNQITGGFLLQLIMLLGVGIMMLTISPKLALFTLIPVPAVIAGSFVFWRHIYW